MKNIESKKLSFYNEENNKLAAVLEIPKNNEVKGYALYSHCFGYSKDTLAAVKIARYLASAGIATLRFDFTGLGESEGTFSSTTFTSKVHDIYYAVKFLREHYEAPKILLGHSLGGAATLAAARNVPEAVCVASLCAPYSPSHIEHVFKDVEEDIYRNGVARVQMADKELDIGKDFVKDVRSYEIQHRISQMQKALLIMHSPTDNIVGIDNAQEIYSVAKHPKSFIALHGASHFLNGKDEALKAARIVEAWASYYL